MVPPSRVPETRELLAAVERGAYSSEYELRKAAPELLTALCDEIEALSTRVDRELVHMVKPEGGPLCGHSSGYMSSMRLTHDYDKVVCKNCFDELLSARVENEQLLAELLVACEGITDSRNVSMPQSHDTCTDALISVPFVLDLRAALAKLREERP